MISILFNIYFFNFKSCGQKRHNSYMLVQNTYKVEPFITKDVNQRTKDPFMISFNV